LGATVVGLLGCHTHPNLKPPEQPEVLAVPSADDKRYCQPARYPDSELAGDAVKKNLNQQTPITPVRGPKPGAMMPGRGYPSTTRSPRIAQGQKRLSIARSVSTISAVPGPSPRRPPQASHTGQPALAAARLNCSRMRCPHINPNRSRNASHRRSNS